MTETDGRLFRQAWIDGVRAHYPGEPKSGYVTPWDDMPEWEQAAAASVFDQVRLLLDATNGAASRLSRTQKGQYVAICWVAQIYLRVPNPKPAYVADWDQLPPWQQETDADIFEAIEGGAQQAGLTKDPTPGSQPLGNWPPGCQGAGNLAFALLIELLNGTTCQGPPSVARTSPLP